MSGSIADIPKKRGRPPGGKGRAPGVLVRVPSALDEKIDRWIECQPDGPSKPEAIRRLVELGLGR